MIRPIDIKLCTILGLLCLGVALVGCAPAVKVRSDSDPSVDFSSYQNYDFFTQLGIEGEGYATLLGQHFREAISQQMGSRGFEQSDTPQLRVNVTIATDDKVRVNTYQDPYLYGGYYGGPRMGPYWGSPMYYGGSTQTTVTQYTEANVYIDLVDAGMKRLVWQGVATFTLTSKMQKDVRASVFNTVNEIFTQFPVPSAAAE